MLLIYFNIYDGTTSTQLLIKATSVKALQFAFELILEKMTTRRSMSINEEIFKYYTFYLVAQFHENSYVIGIARYRYKSTYASPNLIRDILQ